MRWKNFVQETHGAVLPLSAIFIVVLLGACALAIDVGHYIIVKNQLQNAADAGAMAGARALFPNDLKAATWPVLPDCSNAVTVGTQAAYVNQTDRAPTVVADIETGHYDLLNRTFIAVCSSDNATFTNAVKVTTHRVDTPLFFAQILGVVPKTLQATSIAAKFTVTGLNAGKGFPVAVGKKYVHENKPLSIPLNDDTSDMGCWWLPGQTAPPYFAADLKNALDTPDTYVPALEVKDNWIYMNNGVINAAEQIIDSKYHNMDVYLPVVDEIKFRQATQIEYFLKFTIDKTVKINGKHYLVGYAWNASDCPDNFANNNASEDYSMLTLKPAQMVF